MSLLFCNAPPSAEFYTLSLHDALPIFHQRREAVGLTHDVARLGVVGLLLLDELGVRPDHRQRGVHRSEEHTSELQSRENLVCRLLLEKKKSIGEYITDQSGKVTYYELA